MSTTIHTIPLRNERDVVLARQRAREIAHLLGFDNQEQIRLATATSEMARNAFRYARGGKVVFDVALEVPQLLRVSITDSGAGIPNLKEIMEGRYRSQTGMGIGIIGTRRLMDNFDIQTTASGTTVRMSKQLPVNAHFLTAGVLQTVINRLKSREPESPYEEIERQNQELLKTLQELRSRQEELALLNRELEDTNRGVVALYAELDERADYLRRASELKTNFLSNISHEFRTPLNSISSLARILIERMDGDLTLEQEKQVRFISEAARSLSEMVNDLLDLAKVEAGKVKICIKTFDVGELFSALKGMLKPLLADNASVDLVFDDPSSIPPLRTDEGKVSQILRNFISNAIKFTPQGEVRVSARVGSNGVVVFTVQDTGIGIAREHHETIFQEFTQIENPLQQRYRGTGLGLPLCRNLSILLGGRVWMESEPGQGSTFYTEIPMIYHGEADVADTLPEVPVPEFARAPVLLIDDNPEVFSVLEPYFRKTEFQLISVESEARARQWLDRHMPEAILCDIFMDGVPVFGLLGYMKERIHAAGAQVPIIAISIYDQGQKAVASGAELFLKKPLDENLLLRELRERTGRQQPRRLLLVDDNDLSLYILRELLSRPWLDLLEARNGQEALEMIHSEPPDAVILDLVMPGMDGFEVLKELRSKEETRSLPVIIFTSKVLSNDEKQQLEKFSVGLLTKSEIATTLAPELLLNSLRRLGITEPRNA
jgi:signal transduction histidine kinase/CheY-like chemotaxis protein